MPSLFAGTDPLICDALRIEVRIPVKLNAESGDREHRTRRRRGRTRTDRGRWQGGEDGGQVRGPEQPRLPRPSLAGGPWARRRGGPGSAPRPPPSTRSTALSPARGVQRGYPARVAARAGRRRPAVNLIPPYQTQRGPRHPAGASFTPRTPPPSDAPRAAGLTLL